MRDRVPAPTAGRPAAGPAPVAPAQPGSTAASLLRLQRLAGNAAVVQRVAAGDFTHAIGTAGLSTDEIGGLVAELELRTTSWEQQVEDTTAETKRREALTTWVRTQLPARLGKLGTKVPPPDQPARWMALLEPEMERIGIEERSLHNQDLEALDAIIGELTQDVVPVAGRVLVECAMAQGVMGDLGKYLLYSDGFSSCSPVFMYNSGNRLGGIFHFAAGGRGQLPELTAMYQAIAPTWIGVNIRPGKKDNPYDVDQLKRSRMAKAKLDEEEFDYDDLYEWELPTHPDDDETLIMNPFDLDWLRDLFNELGGPEPELTGGGWPSYCLAHQSGAKPTVTANAPTYRARLNVTALTALPGELTPTGGLQLFYNAKHYSTLFAKET